MTTMIPVCPYCGNEQTIRQAVDRWQCLSCGSEFTFDIETRSATNDWESWPTRITSGGLMNSKKVCSAALLSALQ